MTQLTANDLKVRGVTAMESALADQAEATISVRGKDRFVVMDIAHHPYLREGELEAALNQSRADVAAGRALSGRLTGVYSVSIHVPYRINLALLIQDQTIVPTNVGDHDTVYG